MCQLVMWLQDTMSMIYRCHPFSAICMRWPILVGIYASCIYVMSTSWYMHVLNLVCTTLYYLQYDLQNMTHNVYVLVYSVMQLYENMQE